ncbi:MAG: GNAT family N-acetyltransferase [Pseudomonadota bacterium]|nr:GNAT family N-acetyltransferase [Pseudomonadota bacterium]
MAALRSGWSPDNLRPAAADEELQRIETDPDSYLELLTDPQARGGPVTLPDGTQVPRLPGFRRWIWDGEFCGIINLRWQPGTEALPAYALGHVGYAVVPWKRRRGYASAALRLMLPLARAEGLRWIEVTTDLDNVASQAVVKAAGGVLVERFVKPAAYGSIESVRFRVPTQVAAAEPSATDAG